MPSAFRTQCSPPKCNLTFRSSGAAVPVLLLSSDCSSRKTVPFTFETLDTAPVADTAIIDAGLDASNGSAAPLHDVRPITCVARAPSGQVVGGAVGRTWGECAELQQLWVAPEHRRNGMGSQLVKLFEAGAEARGCRTLYLTTFSFQAPALYQSFGYRSTAELRGFPSGIVMYLMVRTIAPDERPNPALDKADDRRSLRPPETPVDLIP